MQLVSFVGAVMPIVYASIAFISILVHGQVENVDYSMIQKSDTVSTVMNVFSGIGAMYYAYGGEASGGSYGVLPGPHERRWL
jgi:hypothetical protein